MLNLYFLKNSKVTKMVVIFLFICIAFKIFFTIFEYSGILTIEGYSKENGKWVYITGNEGQGRVVHNLDADNDTFVILKDGYAKDKNSVFHCGDVKEEMDPNTFEIINDELDYAIYAKDAKNVYVGDTKIIDANPQTFIYLKCPYSRDDKHIYCGTIPMFVNNIEEFKVTEGGKGIESGNIDFFLETNPEYDFIDTKKYAWVVVSDQGKGETKTQKFQGYKEVS